jgi:hypothetical protein
LQFAGITKEEEEADLPAKVAKAAAKAAAKALAKQQAAKASATVAAANGTAGMGMDGEGGMGHGSRGLGGNVAAAAADGGESDGSDVGDGEEEHDAVSELNHCTQMNAWPVAVYTDTTPALAPANAHGSSSSSSRSGSSSSGGGRLGPLVASADAAAPLGGWQTEALVLQPRTAPDVLREGSNYAAAHGATAAAVAAVDAMSDAPTLGPAHGDAQAWAGGVVPGGGFGSAGGGGALGAATLERPASHGFGGGLGGSPIAAAWIGGGGGGGGLSSAGNLVGTGLLGSGPSADWSPGAPPPPAFSVGHHTAGLSFTPQSAGPGGGKASKGNAPGGSSSSSTGTGSSSSSTGTGSSAGSSATGARVFSMEVTCEVRGDVFSAAGAGSSKKRAKQAAAKALLDQLVATIGPVLAQPTSRVAGCALLACFQAVVARSAAGHDGMLQAQAAPAAERHGGSSSGGGASAAAPLAGECSSFYGGIQARARFAVKSIVNAC